MNRDFALGREGALELERVLAYVDNMRRERDENLSKTLTRNSVVRDAINKCMTNNRRTREVFLREEFCSDEVRFMFLSMQVLGIWSHLEIMSSAKNSLSDFNEIQDLYDLLFAEYREVRTLYDQLLPHLKRARQRSGGGS